MMILLGSCRVHIFFSFGGLVDKTPTILVRRVDVRPGRWHSDLDRILSFVRLDKAHFRNDLAISLRSPRNIVIYTK